MSTKIEYVVNNNPVDFYSISNETNNWEPFIVEGSQCGEVAWLRLSESVSTGFWRHKPEDHPDGMPYGVATNETFIVLEGEAEVTTVNGDKFLVKSGNPILFQRA